MVVKANLNTTKFPFITASQNLVQSFNKRKVNQRLFV